MIKFLVKVNIKNFALNFHTIPPKKGDVFMGKKKLNVEFGESELWVQVDSDGKPIGEPKEVSVLLKGVETKRYGFAITYLAELIKLIDTIGNKKMRVVKYILEKMDSNNKVTETVQEIADNCKVSKPIVIETLQLLESVGFIARKTGLIMLSPKIAHKGNYQRERFLMTKFFEVQNKEVKPLYTDNSQ